MTNKEAIKTLYGDEWLSSQEEYNEARERSKKALELLDTLTDRPCSVCRHRKENGCCKWDCVFDGYYGGKK